MDFTYFKPSTQKAKGIDLLQRGGCSLSHFPTIQPPQKVVFMASNMIGAQITFPCFARPCPMRPRHGFVESRTVNNMDDLAQLWQAARVADPEAEMVLMPVYTGRISVVAHSAGVSWGKNNDGATSGNGALNIPCPGSRPFWSTFTGSSKEVGIINEGWIECVENSLNLVAVQLRDGPIMETNPDFIPSNSIGVIVTRIVTVKDLDVADNHPDALLHWEKYIIGLSGIPGVVIALSNKTLASHFAVHGIVAGLPVICSEAGIDKLRIGSVLEGVSSAKPLDTNDMKVIAGHTQSTKSVETVLGFGGLFESLGTLHASSIWDNQPHLLRLRAHMPIVLTRFLAAAALGELRHFSGVLRSNFSELDFSRSFSRDCVYDKTFTAQWKELSPALKFCSSREGFAVEAQRGSSYGGPKWAKIAKLGFRLHCQTDLFCRVPTVKRWNQVIKTCNIAVNLCHNCGNVLTKWTPSAYLDYVAQCPSIGFMNISAGEHCLQLPSERV